MTRTDEPGSAARLDRWLDTVEGMSMGPLDHFTCTEVSALADLMAYHRGEAAGTMVIVHHLWDGDEEHDELAAHLEEWPELRGMLTSTFSEDVRILQTLKEIDEEGKNDAA